MGEISGLYSVPLPVQRVAGYVALIFAITSVFMLVELASNSDTAKGYLGGLNWNEYTFNWHPVMMVSGLIFCSLAGILQYRLMPVPKSYSKMLHGLLHFGGITCLTIGLVAVIRSHNLKTKNPFGVYLPNLYSPHSLCGCGAIVIYGSNYLLGFANYALPMPLEIK